MCSCRPQLFWGVCVLWYLAFTALPWWLQPLLHGCYTLSVVVSCFSSSFAVVLAVPRPLLWCSFFLILCCGGGCCSFSAVVPCWLLLYVVGLTIQVTMMIVVVYSHDCLIWFLKLFGYIHLYCMSVLKTFEFVVLSVWATVDPSLFLVLNVALATE